MGQLEKYGLYVLCLVIFLILGVAIWGDPEVQRAPSSGTAGNPALVVAGGLMGDQGPGANREPRPRLGDLIDGGGGPSPNEVGGRSPAPAPGPEVVTPPPQPQPQARPQHKVASGDTFDSIARQLGSPRLVGELQRLNPSVVPARMQLGTMLDLPTKAEIDALLAKASGSPVPAVSPGGNPGASASNAGQPAPSAEGKRSYKVTRGDTLEGIARRELGDPRRVGEIRKLNPSVDPLSLKIGHTLTLPAK